LAAFAGRHLSLPDTRRFLELIVADCGIPPENIPSTGPAWALQQKISFVASTYLTKERTLRFLSVLEQRRQAGQALIQR
jgi:hypothetical protein